MIKIDWSQHLSLKKKSKTKVLFFICDSTQNKKFYLKNNKSFKNITFAK